jgi:hypothetical protein
MIRTVCEKCGGTEFYQEKTGRNRCAQCQKERMRAIYASEAYKTKHRHYDRLKRRRCSSQEYNKRLKEQDGKCAICNVKLDDKLRAEDPLIIIDHSHETGILRGLLCDNCNWGLGNFKDNPKFLLNAIKYLEYHQVETPK